MNDTISATAMNVNSSCYHLLIGINDILYFFLGVLSARSQNIAEQWSINTRRVADSETARSALNMLNTSCEIVVDIKLNLLSNFANHRIQFFQRGQSNGSIIAENGSVKTMLLSYRTAILLDSDRYLFLVDQNNYLVIG
jgi:hypothetical protein